MCKTQKNKYNVVRFYIHTFKTSTFYTHHITQTNVNQL